MSARAGELLREGLLNGSSVAVAGGGGAVADAVRAAVESLGGGVAGLTLAAGDGPAEQREEQAQVAVRAALGELGALDALVVDCSGPFLAGGRDALGACLAATWDAVRAAAAEAFLPTGSGGRILLLAPADGMPFAPGAAAALENLARTLSIEWARHGITVVAVAPGAAVSPEQLATLSCYLLSPAGAYFSGCLMDLRGPGSA